MSETLDLQSIKYNDKPIEALPRGELIQLVYVLCQTIHEMDVQLEALHQANEECKQEDVEEIFAMMDTDVRH